MIKQLDDVISNLRYKADIIRNTVNIEFENLYTSDKNYTYTIDKDKKEVVVKYYDITFGFSLPVISVDFKPPLSSFLFKKTYTHKMVNTFQLQYMLSMYYVMCLNTYIKNGKQ